MSPRQPVPEDLEPIELGEGEELIVYRIVRSDDHDSEEFARSFLSHAELGLPPRRGSPEEGQPLIYKGISVYETAEAAAETARRFPRIGRYIAKMRLNRASGATYYRWGPRGHLTIWGDSLRLRETVVDTIEIE